ncbi:MAG: peptide chain release factor-like protein [Planctomycetota bacterium]
MTDKKPSTHPSELEIEVLLKQCEIKRTRGQGPGGQHRNKVETGIVIKDLKSGIAGRAGETRSQDTNQKRSIDRLRINLALAIRTDRKIEEFPSERWKSRISGNRITVSPKNFDFAWMLAESLDVAKIFEFDLTQVALRLGVSKSQLIKFWKLSNAFQLINHERTKQGLKPLK